MAFFPGKPAFWTIGATIGLIFGGVPAAERPLLLSLVPEKDAGRFFSLLLLSSRAGSFLGPVVVGYYRGPARAALRQWRRISCRAYHGGRVLRRITDRAARRSKQEGQSSSRYGVNANPQRGMLSNARRIIPVLALACAAEARAQSRPEIDGPPRPSRRRSSRARLSGQATVRAIKLASPLKLDGASTKTCTRAKSRSAD